MTVRGCETPRIYTPPKRELTPETTHGYACIAFAEQVMGLKLFPWQKWLLKHALELNEDGTYRFRYVIVLVGRQNGKSMVLLILALWHLFAMGSREVIATAQDLARAEKQWEEAVEWCENDDELCDLIDPYRGHPKTLTVLPDDEIPWKREYRVASASRRGGRGFSADLILMDELREHQSWDSWSAVTNTMNARPNAQAWAFSNAGDQLSVVLRYLRAQAHKRLGWPDGDADAEILGDTDSEMEEFLAQAGADELTGFYEWSSPPGSARTDLESLAQANPSMNHTDVAPNCITDRAIIGALANSPPWEFDTEVRCLWVSMSALGPFPEGSWEETLDREARPDEGSPQVVCVAVSRNRSKTYIARAGWGTWVDESGREITGPVFGIQVDRAGTDWVVDWLIENRHTYEYIVAQDKGAPVSSLIFDIEQARDKDGGKLPYLPWGSTDVVPATGIMFDRLNRREIKHVPHPGMDLAASTALTKRSAREGFEIDVVKSVHDAQPLQAAIGAVWALEAIPPRSEPKIHEWPDQNEIDEWMNEIREEMRDLENEKLI